MHQSTAQLTRAEAAPIINPNLYGHFAEHLGRCIYEGLWVGEESEIPNTRGIRKDVVAALRDLDIPVLRWPGGCFADEYHWKDGVGAREHRKRMYNSHWGGVVENNHFGTHEFFELCEQLACKPYVCGNLGSGTVQEMSEWVEYITSPAESPMANWRRVNGRHEPWRLPYFGVGNESWGCGGHMRAEYYADQYRRYNTYVRTYGPHKIERIACGPNIADYHWTEVLMERAAQHMDGLSLHSYTLQDQKWPPSGSATEFGETEWYSILKAALAMDELIEKHSAIMDKFDPAKRIGLIFDEWGTWYPVEPGTEPGFLYQQNSLRDALVAAVHFHIFHKHADRLTMANIAQTVNVLQAMILTDGPRMILTPTYWVFKMFKRHQGARVLPVSCDTPHCIEGVQAVSVSASQREGENVFVTAACIDPSEGARLSLHVVGVSNVDHAQLLTSPKMQDHNTFSDPEKVAAVPFTGYSIEGDTVTLELPPKSIVSLELLPA